MVAQIWSSAPEPLKELQSRARCEVNKTVTPANAGDHGSVKLKNANLALLQALMSGFAGLMDPGIRPDDVVHVSSVKKLGEAH